MPRSKRDLSVIWNSLLVVHMDLEIKTGFVSKNLESVVSTGIEIKLGFVNLNLKSSVSCLRWIKYLLI